MLRDLGDLAFIATCEKHRGPMAYVKAGGYDLIVQMDAEVGPVMLVPAALFPILGVLQDPPPLPLPMDPGLTIVQAVTGDAYQGRDYEAVISIYGVAGGGRGPCDVSFKSVAFVKDRAGKRRWLSVRRTVLGADLQAARSFILGFDTDDPERLPGTTALGPSHLVLQELSRTGRAPVSLRNYAARPEQRGTLKLIDRVTPFPVLVNGTRVRVPALYARAQLEAGGRKHPWEFWFLDHPVQPLTLKAAHGPLGAASVERPEWSRQVVRIDFPAEVLAAAGGGDIEADGGDGELPEGDGLSVGTPGTARAGEGELRGGASAVQPGAGASGLGIGSGAGAGTGAVIERRLASQCRVAVPGIYFEFDSDVLNPASAPWIRGIADLLRRHPDWTITIEGHTDSVGSARYNLDLSTRRAAALVRSLTSQHAIAAARLTTHGFGPDRPLESNATTEGRARNRRVELVRPCERPTR